MQECTISTRRIITCMLLQGRVIKSSYRSSDANKPFIISIQTDTVESIETDVCGCVFEKES